MLRRPIPSAVIPKRTTALAIAGAVAVLLLDQGSKALVRRFLPLHEPQEVIPGFFYLRHCLNEGAAWSILSGARGFLVVVSAVALLLLIGCRREVLGIGRTLGPWTFALLCGGIAGNLVDRILTGRVVDFLDFVFGSYHYPTFNMADSAICVGVFLYILSSFLHRGRNR